MGNRLMFLGAKYSNKSNAHLFSMSHFHEKKSNNEGIDHKLGADFPRNVAVISISVFHQKKLQ